MATSNSKNYSITAATIIDSAHRKIGVFDAGEPTGGDEVSTAMIALNVMSKSWMTQDVDIFIRKQSTLFLQPDQQSYNLSTDEITNTITAETTLSAAEASGQTVLSITSTTGMTTGDRCGVKMDDNTIHWSTITVDSATQGTIATATDADAASGNKVYTYTTKSDRPQKLLFAFRRDINDFDTEVEIIGENDYAAQSNKGSDGPPVECWYNPRGNQATGELKVWPVNGGKNWDKLILINQVLPDDFDVTTNSPDFPIEWSQALIYGLADDLMMEFGELTDRQMDRIERKARNHLLDAIDYSQENASVVFTLGR